MKKRDFVFRCSSCGHEEPKWLGRCPECGGAEVLKSGPLVLPLLDRPGRTGYNFLA